MRTVRCETTLLLVLQAVVAAPAFAVEASQSRARASSNAEYGIVMRVEGEGKCRIEATRDTDVAWTIPRCLGTVDDLYFISNSGERFWVLAALSILLALADPYLIGMCNALYLRTRADQEPADSGDGSLRPPRR